MLFAVVAKSVFADVFSLEPRFVAENSIDAKVIENIIKRDARWLSMNKAGKLVGFDPETEVKICLRLALNAGNGVNPEHTWNVPLEGDVDKTPYEWYTLTLDTAVEQSASYFTYTVTGMLYNGWVLSIEDGETKISRNIIKRISSIIPVNSKHSS